MALNRESLPVLLDRVYNNYMSRFKPLDRTARHNLIRVFSEVDAGIYHQLLGDMSFLSDQLFPDTATGDYLRMHWSDRVTPLYAVSATGKAEVEGIENTAVPAGLVYTSASGKRYFTNTAYKIDSTNKAVIWLTAENAGSDSNLIAGQELKLSSAIPTGLSSKAVTIDKGIIGGVDAETDAEYLARVLLSLRNSTRHGKPGDFAAWAVDSSSGVSKAFELKNFSVFGALLIQVVYGNHFDGINQVGNLNVVTEYINTVAPPVMFTVRTPELLQMDISITLLQSESTTTNQSKTLNRLKSYLNVTAHPGVSYTEGLLSDVIVDGAALSFAKVKFEHSGSIFKTTILQYPVLGDVRFEVQ